MIFKELLEHNPIIPAVKNESELKRALETESQIIFVLFGNILNLSSIATAIKEKEKLGIIHLDLVEGLASKEIAVHYIKEQTVFNGIISTKPQLIKTAKVLELIAIQRIFILDGMSLENTRNHIVEQCDAVEMLPGILFKVIETLTKTISKPLIVGGLISEKDEVVEALGVGATCISTSSEKVWEM